MQQPPSRQSDNPSTIEINDPTTENVLQNEAVKTTYALTLTLFAQNHTDIDMCRNLFQPFSCAIHTLRFYSSLHFFRALTSITFSFLFSGQFHIYKEHEVKLTEMQHSK